jgi:alkylation response protein AidB-like acyl-CoA dehydrogenase
MRRSKNLIWECKSLTRHSRNQTGLDQIRISNVEQGMMNEFCDFFQSEWVQGIVRELEDEEEQYDTHSQELYLEMGKRGWLALQWPKKYGGRGLSQIEMGIFVEEMAFNRIPASVWGLSVGIFGNSLRHIGSEKQRMRYLPGIAKGETLACLLYSEPNAGSDLAALETRAVEEGDQFVVNGTKIFTSIGHIAHHGLLAARTDSNVPKHKGISLFIVSMDSPGISINPMWHLADGRVNEISLEDVRVPRENMVGEKDKGWKLLNQALAVERTSIGFAARCRIAFDDILDYVREKRLENDPIIRQKLGQIATEVEMARLLAWRVVALQVKGEIPDVEASMAKYYSSEAAKRIANIGMQFMGMEGLLKRGSIGASMEGRMESTYRSMPFLSIGAGTTEIMKMMIAYRGLQVHK